MASVLPFAGSADGFPSPINSRRLSCGCRLLQPFALLAILAALSACHERTPSGPGATDLTGTWTGTSTYPNAPFQLSLSQTSSTLRGEYRDGLDRSLAVTGTYMQPAMSLVVDFGDAKLNLEGNLDDARTVRGMMWTSALGNREYPFTMTR